MDWLSRNLRPEATLVSTVQLLEQPVTVASLAVPARTYSCQRPAGLWLGGIRLWAAEGRPFQARKGPHVGLFWPRVNDTIGQIPWSAYCVPVLDSE